ncbi:DUF5668 domain-containing protein [Coriobacteriia bacterium Es71-Z0120]|uniref:LiaI-LiaF-like domain-containing protein n=1 Tax=Parvivirga hydrogeniphila TaxID=2939460 RepID=UPI002260E3BB|nr:DUF5668 domain-containing protein [Parvivirga hydrogeniphila]MCL4078222.1 DUF5668 domain-containing protein [Parvivirga hydrogeniphila]
MMRAKRVVEGLTVVALGSVLLANTLGALSWSVWADVFSLWPLLIIAAGLDILGKGLGREWVRVAASLVVLAGLLYAVFASASGIGVAPAQRTASGATEDFSFVEPASASVMRGVAVVRGGAGRVSVEAGEALAAASGRSPFVPTFDVSRQDGTARVETSLGSHPWLWTGRAPSAELDVALSRDLPWDLTIEAGAGQLEADLTELRLTRARIDAGVSESTLTFGEADGVVPVEIHTGVSSVTLRFPRDAAFRVMVRGGLVSFESDEAGGVERTSDASGVRTYEHGPEQAADRFDVEIQAGLSSVAIELY